MENIFSIGVDGLDRLLGDALTPGVSIVIAGHPGSGKTTLASTICYTNALRGHKCLYVSFQESKQKLVRNMRRLGIDFNLIESKKLFHFVKYPLVVDADAMQEIIEGITSLVVNVKPRVLVIDSITPLLKAIGSNIKARSVLQNFFAELPGMIEGIVVLITEIPMSEERIEIGDIEFVADIIIILRHRVERDLLIRDLEIRKVRGAAITLARMPFTIVEGKGIVAYAPVVLEEIPPPKHRKLEFHCSVLRKYLEYVKKGQIIYMTYPSDARPVPIYVHFLGFAYLNNLKVLLISYKSSPQELKELMLSAMRELGVNEDLAMRLINKHFIIKGINPASLGTGQLGLWEIRIIEELKPDAVVFHGVDVVANIEDPITWRVGLLNQMLHLKSLGILIVRMGSYDDRYLWHTSLADLVFKLYLTKEKGELKYNLYMWKRGKSPVILNQEELIKCREEVAEIIKKSSLAGVSSR